VKLLFDENVSPKLPQMLANEYSGSVHIREVPKVIWLDVGNAGTTMIAGLLRRERQRVEAFEKQDETSFLILSLGLSAV